MVRQASFVSTPVVFRPGQQVRLERRGTAALYETVSNWGAVEEEERLIETTARRYGHSVWVQEQAVLLVMRTR